MTSERKVIISDALPDFIVEGVAAKAGLLAKTHSIALGAVGFEAFDFTNPQLYGLTRYQDKSISLWVKLPLDSVSDTLSHELAHLAAAQFDNEHGHGEAWKKWATVLGADPSRFFEERFEGVPPKPIIPLAPPKESTPVRLPFETQLPSKPFNLSGDDAEVRASSSTLDRVAYYKSLLSSSAPTPFEYQAADVDELHKLYEHSKTFVWNLSEMGTGKTMEALLFIESLSPPVKAVLVLCPNSVKYVWKRQIEFWLGQKAAITGDHPHDRFTEWFDYVEKKTEPPKYYILHYDALRKDDYFDIVNNMGFDFVIWDEAHKLRNIETKQYRGAK